MPAPTESTQAESILFHLREVGPITPLEALREYGVFRLAARIYELRQRGIPIDEELIDVGKAKIARYRLVKRIEVERVPITDRVKCLTCGAIAPAGDIPELVLGGFRKGICPNHECPSRKLKNPTSLFSPVK